MNEQPSLQTPRLFLRHFGLSDAADVRRLAGDPAVADTTLNVPHPYEEGMAEKWISTHKERFESGELINFAITLLADGALVGAMGLHITPRHERAELGYWIGKPYWNRGYCTEAARAVIRHGFDVAGLNRIEAHHFSRNPASGKVMQKIGMRHEGTLRRHIKKGPSFEDAEVYGILRDDPIR